METARSTDPLRVTRALEGLSFLGAAGPVAIRGDNHQLLQPLFVARLDPLVGSSSGTAAASSKFGWQTILRGEAGETQLETTCQMRRPPEPRNA